MGWGRGVSRVLFRDGHLSRPRRTGPRERGRLSTSDLGEQPDSGHVGDCCGEDCPFQPASLLARPEWLLLLSPRSPVAPVWTVDAGNRASPAFTGHPRSVQLGLSSAAANDDSDHPLAPEPIRLSTRGGRPRPLTSGRRAPGRKGVVPSATVPKGRLELPRVSSLRPERSASAISPLRHGAGQRPRGADLGTRTPDLLFTKQLLYRLS